MLRVSIEKSFESGLFNESDQSDLERRAKLFDKEALKIVPMIKRKINWCYDKEKDKLVL